MRQTIALMLALVMLGGCFGDDDETPGDGDGTGTGTGTGTGSGGTGGTGGTGGNGDDNVTRETVQVTITWEGAYLVNGEYTSDTVRVPANSTVELTFENDEVNPVMAHDVVVSGIEGASTDVIDPGEDTMVTFDVDGPVETKFFCSVPGHRDNGMEGDFIVE